MTLSNAVVQSVDTALTARREKMLALLQASRQLAQKVATVDDTAPPDEVISLQVKQAFSDLTDAKLVLKGWTEAVMSAPAKKVAPVIEGRHTDLLRAQQKLRGAELAMAQCSQLVEKMQSDAVQADGS